MHHTCLLTDSSLVYTATVVNALQLTTSWNQTIHDLNIAINCARSACKRPCQLQCLHDVVAARSAENSIRSQTTIIPHETCVFHTER